MAGYAQPGTKRQKVREARSDNVDYFQGKLFRGVGYTQCTIVHEREVLLKAIENCRGIFGPDTVLQFFSNVKGISKER